MRYHHQRCPARSCKGFDALVTRAMVFIGCVLVVSLCAVGGECRENVRLLGFKKAESDSVPEGWEVVTYFRTPQNTMSLEEEERRTVLRVRSLGSASALMKRVDIRVDEFPLLVWRWKVNRVVGMAVEHDRTRNDSAARIRVVFGSPVSEPPTRPPEVENLLKAFGLQKSAVEPSGYKIDYIWATRLAQGSSIDYPGKKDHKIIAVQSGSERTGRWVWEQRNLKEDFARCFEVVPPHLIAIVVLTDTDATNEGIRAAYSSIVVMHR